MGIHRAPRIGAAFLICFSALSLPWPITATLGILFAVIYERYYELILLGLAIDLLYAVASSNSFFPNPYPATVISLILYVTLQFLKKRILALSH